MNEIDQIKLILIVEDHPDASRVLASICTQTFVASDVSCTNSIKGARALLEKIDFDLALIDIGLPDGNGIELIAEIKKQSQKSRCVMTTIFDDDQHLFNALRAGADGYLIKGHTPDELKSFLVDAVNGKLALSSEIAQSILTYFRTDYDQEDPESNELLTLKENKILQLIAKGSPVKEVSEKLDITKNTVAYHIKNIYTKLNIHNRAEATAAAIKLNLFKPEK